MAKKTNPKSSFPNYSGTNSMLVNAYRGYYGAEAMAGIANNPTMQMQQMLMTMGQEWIKQKEKDKQESMAFVKKTTEITDRIPGASLLNTQANGVMTQRIYEIVQEADQFAKAGDMQGYGQAMQKARHIANQMKDFEGAFNLHAQGLTEEAYSKNADTVPLNTIFKEGGGYEMYFDENNNIKFRAPADHTGGTPFDYSIDDLKGGMKLKKTEVGDLYEGDMLKQMKYQKTTQEYDFDDGHWNKKINAYVNKKDNLISIFHDDIFGMTRDDGSPITLADMWREENPGQSDNWMRSNTENKIALDGLQGGFNENAMREYAVRKIKDHVKNEWDSKKNAIMPENKNPNEIPNQAPFSNKQNYGEGILGSNLNSTWNALKSGTVNIGGEKYNQQSDGSWNSSQGTLSGNQVMEKLNDALGWSNSILGMDEFKYFRGTVGKSDGSSGGGEKDLSPFFGKNANEENAVEKLSIMYPDLNISSPPGMREKIKVNGETFYLRGKGKSTPEMEMKRLQEYITSIDPLNPN